MAHLVVSTKSRSNSFIAGAYRTGLKQNLVLCHAKLRSSEAELPRYIGLLDENFDEESVVKSEFQHSIVDLDISDNGKLAALWYRQDHQRTLLTHELSAIISYRLGWFASLLEGKDFVVEVTDGKKAEECYRQGFNPNYTILAVLKKKLFKTNAN